MPALRILLRYFPLLMSRRPVPQMFDEHSNHLL